MRVQHVLLSGFCGLWVATSVFADSEAIGMKKVDIIIGKDGTQVTGELLTEEFTIALFGTPVDVPQADIWTVHFKNPPEFPEDEIRTRRPAGDRYSGEIRQRELTFRLESGEELSFATEAVHTIWVDFGHDSNAPLDAKVQPISCVFAGDQYDEGSHLCMAGLVYECANFPTRGWHSKKPQQPCEASAECKFDEGVYSVGSVMSMAERPFECMSGGTWGAKVE